MSLWASDSAAAATGGVASAPFVASGVSIDTRTLRPGDLFVALQATGDGHAHVPAAFAAGAAAAMVHADVPGAGPVLRMADTLDGLTALGRAGRARFGGRVVAVTGSVGKTTTKEMLRAALRPFGAVHAAEASYNNHWGVPLTLARLPASAAFCVCEVGMNTAGEIAPLARLVRPDVAVITNVGTAHIGRLGSQAAIAEEKSALFDGLTPAGVAVVPADAPFVERLVARAPGAVVRFGPDGIVRATGTEMTAGGTVLRADVAGTPVTVRLAVPGGHMAANALAVLAAAHALGLDPVVAAGGLEGFAAGAGRGRQRDLGGVLLLDESYNASSASVRAALSVLRLLPARRRLAVLGDMLELGEFAVAEHAGLAPDVARAADLLYACGPLTRCLFDRVPPGLRGAHAADAEALAPIVAGAVRPGDAVLVKGSLGSRMRVVVRALEAPAAAGAA